MWLLRNEDKERMGLRQKVHPLGTVPLQPPESNTHTPPHPHKQHKKHSPCPLLSYPEGTRLFRQTNWGTRRSHWWWDGESTCSWTCNIETEAERGGHQKRHTTKSNRGHYCLIELSKLRSDFRSDRTITQLQPNQPSTWYWQFWVSTPHPRGTLLVILTCLSLFMTLWGSVEVSTNNAHNQYYSVSSLWHLRR